METEKIGGEVESLVPDTIELRLVRQLPLNQPILSALESMSRSLLKSLATAGCSRSKIEALRFNEDRPLMASVQFSIFTPEPDDRFVNGRLLLPNT